ncbi:S26 family signal peptidase [Fimbriiglobus ruber]|uniref:Signal peptidase I n=1 Tax=Fimbriiglobus ruber TaxID=1908690 RepID=A0A225E5A1_9BACT|nr:S26 family signal peptidase [Fimbriiglobus ruber]OWK43855.1 Signal peptidase I [Fimbriiglobus ruber]
MDHGPTTAGFPTTGYPLAPVAPSPEWTASDPSSPPAPAAPPATPPRPMPNPVRWLVQFGVLFFCLFLFVRTAALEPFGVPTGSMAEALIGNHRAGDCPRCGFPVRVGEPGPEARPVRFEACACPNCGAAVDLSRAREVFGDRLMVDKTVYHARSPRRWEIAVFRCPADLSKPYVKRVIGLPGELIQISDGDIYAGGQLVRKTLAQVRETRVPVFDMSYPPQGGWALRWLDEPIGQAPKLPPTRPPAEEKTVDGSILRDNTLMLDATGKRGEIGLTYRHWNLDSRTQEPVSDYQGYNGGPADRRGGFGRARPDADTAVHDFVLEFDLEVRTGSGAFACRLGDGADTVRADFPVVSDGTDPGDATVYVAHDGPLAPVKAPGLVLRPGKTYRVTFALVDRRASLAIDGREVVPPLDLPAGPPGKSVRRGVPRPAQLGARGVSVAVRDFKLYRDIHYLSPRASAGGWHLGANEYFMLGDNTSNSHDSRVWTIDNQPAPGVPEKDFIGKPFLIHQPMRLGRIPIFGREYKVQTLDWSRLRWLR